MIVDDEPGIVDVVQRYFALSGYEVIAARSGEEALKKISCRPDLILLDINMPGLNGLEVCARIRAHVSCPILFLTARIERSDKIVGFQAGGDDYIVKPFDMEVLAYTRTPRPDEEGVRYVPLDTLLRESDAVTLHCPLTEQTRHLIDEAALAKMKPTAFLINTSRGALIDEPALIRALTARQIAGAGLDVLEQEPPRPDNPLYTLDNVVLTPHMGWKGLETRQRLVDLLGENIAAFCRGEPRNVIV